MYVRMARFEGADPAELERQLEMMRRPMDEMTADESGQGPNREQMEWLGKVTKRMLVLADKDKGSSAMLVFVDSKDDVRKMDEMMNAMSPGTGGGKRASADIYEVAIDRQMS